jgi:hypothetical protein
MLETILKIGELLRQSADARVPSDAIKHHRYFVPAPKSDAKSKRIVKKYSIAVGSNLTFDFSGVSEINQDDAALYYFRYKTSESDNQYRYIYGDIYFAVNKDGKQCGHYRTSPRSFLTTKKSDLAPFLKSKLVENFRAAFAKQADEVERFLLEKASAIVTDDNTKERGVFLHFRFEGEKEHWYQREELEAIKQGVIETFFDQRGDRYTMKKSLYNALSSYQEDLQFPNFSRDDQFKTRDFTAAEANALVYAISYAENPTLKIKNLNIVVLPQGDEIERKDLEAFASRKNLDEQVQAERTLARKATDPLLRAVTDDVPQSVMQFDLIFREAGKNVDVDAVELSGIRKSFLSVLSDRVKHCRNYVIDERAEHLAKANVPDDFESIDIEKSFRHVFDGTIFDYKKTQDDERVSQPKKLRNERRFHGHLFRVLPQIYAGAYMHDRLLLPALIENTEYKIRNGKTGNEAQDYFNFARFDYFFLTKLQVNGEQTMNELNSSPSYEAGKLLGELARPINFKIGSFSKTHVGMLTRRIANVNSLVALINEISEIMSRHDLATSPRRKISSDLMSKVREMTDKDYSKNFFAFGFFESYFKPKMKEDDQTTNDETDDGTVAASI